MQHGLKFLKKINMQEIVETELDVLVKTSLNDVKKIILYNDDVNTFENVIDCLIKYCKHNNEQAEQCAMLVHYNGKCDVKNGSFDDLLPIYTALLDNKLKVIIE